MHDIDELRRRAAYIRGDERFARRLIQAMVDASEAREPPVHIEGHIYDSFTGYEDQGIMAAFHEAPWSDRTDLLDRLSDARLKILGERLLYTEAPEVMPTHDRSHLQADLAKRLVADEGTVP